MNACKASTMITLFFSTSQGKNHYTVTSIKTLLVNLLKFHNIDIQRRWCFECLRYLVDEGYIRRKQRYLNDDNGLVTQIPSMISFTLKGVVWLVRKGVRGARKIHRSITKFLQMGDKRFPGQQDFDDGSYRPEDPDQRAALEDLLGIVTKKIN